MNKDNLARRIHLLMQREGLTQQELATLLHISQPAISLYLKGRMPPADILFRIAQIGNCSVEWLLTGRQAKPNGMAIGETPARYGKEALLLQLWEKLPPKIRQDMLVLMQHIVDQLDHRKNR